MKTKFTHTLSIVVPVFRGESVLLPLVEEIVDIFGADRRVLSSHGDNQVSISEIILVHDGGDDGSSRIMRGLESKYEIVKCVWLSRNFGQHAATLAGISHSTGNWIVTLDEDGQQNPSDICNLLDKAVSSNSQLVYAKPTNTPPHGPIRNRFSALAKIVSRYLLTGAGFDTFNSFRLILGEPARSLSAYASSGVYLDAALLWVVASISTCDVELREEKRNSSYNYRSLLGHFGRLVVTSGARPLRAIAILGLIVATVGFLLAIYILWMKFVIGIPASGWTSVIVAVLLTSGLTMLSLGVISEFLGSIVRSSMGKPLFLIASDPIDGPLGENSNDNRVDKNL